MALATILGQVGEQIIHGFIFSDVEQRSTLTPKGDEAGVPKLSQVKRKSRRRQPEALRHGARRKALGPGLHEEAEHIEAVFVGKRAQGGNSNSLFHISNMVEALDHVKCYPACRIN